MWSKFLVALVIATLCARTSSLPSDHRRFYELRRSGDHSPLRSGLQTEAQLAADYPKLAEQLSQILRPYFTSDENSEETPNDLKKISGKNSVEILPLHPSSIEKHKAPLALILTSPKRRGKYFYNKKNKHGYVVANVEISSNNSDEDDNDKDQSKEELIRPDSLEVSNNFPDIFLETNPLIGTTSEIDSDSTDADVITYEQTTGDQGDEDESNMSDDGDNSQEDYSSDQDYLSSNETLVEYKPEEVFEDINSNYGDDAVESNVGNEGYMNDLDESSSDNFASSEKAKVSHNHYISLFGGNADLVNSKSKYHMLHDHSLDDELKVLFDDSDRDKSEVEGSDSTEMFEDKDVNDTGDVEDNNENFVQSKNETKASKITNDKAILADEKMTESEDNGTDKYFVLNLGEDTQTKGVEKQGLNCPIALKKLLSEYRKTRKYYNLSFLFER
ncbi:uncharacterized protein LOC106139358 [Amyelois transitella]|uniref:uncharacterized protein LOC106139358 n=1 Tax=Amyelois transitella TaxID=680683 RepID=UPI00067BB924|nr:uncharacterized protein LOC106139358 [Amyelois transitella]